MGNLLKRDNTEVFWQAHQSTSPVRPENTLVAFEYAWNLGGIPEADIRTTRDGVIICLHDATLARTGNDVPQEYRDTPANELLYSQLKEWDVGSKYGQEYRGTTIPALRDVFKHMAKDEDTILYIDIKDVNIEDLGRLIKDHGLDSRVIVTHNKHKSCIDIKSHVEGVKTMLWIGGNADAIKEKFEEVEAKGFEALDQIQFHLNQDKSRAKNGPKDMPLEFAHWPYELDLPFIKKAYDITKDHGIDLEVLPFVFEEKDIHTLLDVGIRWFAIDYPERFIDCLNSW